MSEKGIFKDLNMYNIMSTQAKIQNITKGNCIPFKDLNNKNKHYMYEISVDAWVFFFFLLHLNVSD